MDEEGRLRTARRASERGGAVARQQFREEQSVEYKDNKTDVVTPVDRAAQDAAADVIAADYPEDPIISEEGDGPGSVPDDGAAWVVDPIDGTNNYVRGVRVWGTSVAAVVDGEPVAAVNHFPALGDTYTAGRVGPRRNGRPVRVSERTDPERFTVAPTVWWAYDRRDEYAAATRAVVERFGDLARFRCAQATLSAVADGSLDAAFTNVDTNPWDTVAGVHLVRQAGGTVTDLDGHHWTNDSTGLIASNGQRHDVVLAAAREITG